MGYRNEVVGYDDEVTSEHTVQDVEIDTMHNDSSVHGVHVTRIMGYNLRDAINVAQWLSEARGERIITIKSI